MSKFEDILKRMNNTPKEEKKSSISLGADEEMSKEQQENRAATERAKQYMEAQGMVVKEHFDEQGELRYSVFRKDDSVLTFDQLWEATDIDINTMSPEEQAELRDFWKRYQVEFIEPDPFKEVNQFSSYFDKMKGGGEG